MKSVIRWAVNNSPAMNTLMISVLAIGALSMFTLRREVFPEFELEIILVTVPYPGASPDEVEEGICQKIEEAVRSVDGIKKQTSIAKEGSGSVVIELEADSDVQKILNEIRSEVDRIPSFPLLAEDPEVKQITLREAAIQVGVLGPAVESGEDELALREVTESIRDDLIRLPEVSQAELLGAKEYQIDIEISEENLRRYGLTLQQVADIVRKENLELPGGTIKTESQDVLLRGKNKRLVGSEIAKIPLVTQPGGVVLTVGDLGTARDEFTDVTSFHRIDGRPGMVVSVERTKSEDLLAMTAAVKDYAASANLPPGYELVTWADRSVDVRDRLELLTRNGLQGLVLVLLVLAIFLNLRLAWWVALGIPIAILGACAVLWLTGHTMNMLTMFAFLMALGIVVDDAIVIGENIYTHRQRGVGFIRAAIEGAIEVLPSVAASIATTIIAFMPLFFVSGVMGKFIEVLPLAMISMLLISLVESTLILPCHLGHSQGGQAEDHTGALLDAARRWRDALPWPLAWTVGALAVVIAFLLEQIAYPFRRVGDLFAWLNRETAHVLRWVIERGYMPGLGWVLKHPTVAIAVAVAVLLFAGGLVRSGVVPYVIFPKLDSKTIQAKITYPDGTPASVTDAATRRLEAAIKQVDAEFREDGQPLVELTRRSVGYATERGGPGRVVQSTGGHLGSVTAELVDTTERNVKSQDIVAAWRQAAGEFPGVEGLEFGGLNMGPGGTPIEFKLLAKSERMDELEAAVERAKDRLRGYPGVFDVTDDSRPGKWEFQLRVKEDARAMGVPMQDLAETVRASYYGEEVMRLQRGRHEVKLMVRYPREDRRSLADFDQLRVRTGNGAERPLTELADVQVERGYSEINRVDQLRSITISADVDEAKGNASQIVEDMRDSFMPKLLEDYPMVRVRWEGQQEQTEESVASLMRGFIIAMIGMFVLLTVEFKSYVQPLLILAIIPFGLIGAVGGHFLLGLPLTLFSLFGLVALTGVIVNDSIVLIDFINHRVGNGMPLREALLDAGRRRFRPVLLTSITTVAGLLPILLETSFQAQILIPMATSLCFGLMTSTILVLFLVPALYFVYGRLIGIPNDAQPPAEPPTEQPRHAPRETLPEPQPDLTIPQFASGD